MCAVIEANDELHLHGDAAAHTLDDADDVGIFPARRHEIDQAHRATRGFDFGFKNQRVAAITTLCVVILSLGHNLQWPFFASPSNEAKHAPESKRGKQSQSTQPSRLTSAPVCVSLRNA